VDIGEVGATEEQLAEDIVVAGVSRSLARTFWRPPWGRD